MSAPIAGQSNRAGAVDWRRHLVWLRLGRLALVAIVLSIALLMAFTVMAAWREDAYLDPFTDATTYLAAGERLNAGHDLYRLGPGDRVPLTTFDLPLLSPPAIAVLWRPIAAAPFGFALWVVACWLALLGTLAYLVFRIGLRAAVLGAALCLPIGEQLAAANVASFFPAILVWTWLHRDDPRAAAVLGGITTLKISPGVMAGWVASQREWRPLAWMGLGTGLLLIVGLIGAGIANNIAYLDVLRAARPSDLSLSGLTGIGWLSSAVLVGGTILAASLRRRQRLSFTVAVTALVAGTPAMYASTLALMIAVLAPLLPLEASASRAGPVAGKTL